MPVNEKQSSSRNAERVHLLMIVTRNAVEIVESGRTILQSGVLVMVGFLQHKDTGNPALSNTPGSGFASEVD